MAQNNVSNTDWAALQQAEDMAYFRAEACLLSPGSYSLEEKKAICDGIDSITDEIDAALKADFESLPPEFRVKLLDMLCASGCMTPEWWSETLVGKMPGSHDDLVARNQADGNPKAE